MMNKFGSELGEFLEFNNISQKEFAYRIGTSQKNLIDIINGKIELTQKMINNIAIVSGISVSYIENVENSFKLDKKNKEFLEKKKENAKEYLKRFKYKEAIKKYDILIHDERDEMNIIRDFMRYLRISDLNQLYQSDNRILYKTKSDAKELLALWVERCYRLSQNQTVSEYKKENIDVLVDFINREAMELRFDEKRLIDEFNKNGIYLVIEDDLPGTKTRGAFKVLDNIPAIYLTRKHRRIADIYYALLHELAHCKSDFNRAKSGCMISSEGEEKESYEIKADEQALNWMIDNESYTKLKANLNLIESGNYNKCFAVYRLALDKEIGYRSDLYQLNNPLIINKG